MRDQDRLGALQMGVSRHGRASCLLGAVESDAQPLRQIGAHLVDRGPYVETEIGCNLFVAAAAAVQFVSGIADQRDQLFFDEVMYIFGFVVVEKRRACRSLLTDLLQTLQNS